MIRYVIASTMRAATSWIIDHPDMVDPEALIFTPKTALGLRGRSIDPQEVWIVGVHYGDEWAQLQEQLEITFIGHDLQKGTP